jgi:hypothetical protein
MIWKKWFRVAKLRVVLAIDKFWRSISPLHKESTVLPLYGVGQESSLLPCPTMDSVPLEPQERSWLSVRFSGLEQLQGFPGKSGRFVGIRSDSRFFCVRVEIGHSTDSHKPPAVDPAAVGVEVVRIAEPLNDGVLEEMERARAILETYRDCSCGIVGYEFTGDATKFDCWTPVYSPCKTHPLTNRANGFAAHRGY